MDARGVQRLLEKIYGMADTAEHVGSKNIETMQREPRVSDIAKRRLQSLYREHALRVQQLHSNLGLAICDAIQNEMEDDTARGQLDLMRANLQSLSEAAKAQLDADPSTAR
jgi:hypothetical protein